jgi:hypothetical protein
LDQTTTIPPEKYLKERVDDQIAWYDKRSRRAKRGFQWCRAIELVGAALIPAAAGFLACGKGISALLGVIVAISASFASLFQFQQNWIEYRTTAESLKKEKMHFLTRTAPYDGDGAFSELVQRIETLVSKENINWSQYTKQQTPKETKHGS